MTGPEQVEFHSLYYTLGPFGRQDIHLHPRFDSKNNVDVLVGFGRTCNPQGLHTQKRLTVRAKWSNRANERQPLADPHNQQAG